ncbi:MAG: FTR1 family protein [Sphingobacteriia bacterium]
MLLGALAAAVASLLGGYALAQAQDSLEETGFAPLLEAVILFASAGILLYVVVWLGRLANPAQQIRQQLAASLGWRVLFGIAFVAVLREGLEAVLFLSAGSEGQGLSWLGILLGFGLAFGLGWLLFGVAKRLPLQRIFTISNFSLIILAAGMMAYGTHELEEFMEEGMGIEEPARAFVLASKQPETPELAASSWYTCKGGTCVHALHDKGSIGSFLKTFLGYNSDPSWIELGVWLATLALGFWLWRRPAARAGA